MQSYQHDFIKLLIQCKALSFGEFTLKSGRVSPYFFNAGVFHYGDDLRLLGQFYASAIENATVKYDVLFGPAYKGIPLVASTAIALSYLNKNIPYAFNRKEAKDHGEGGMIVGSRLNDKNVLIIDDVISAGTTIREVVDILNAANVNISGVVVALDRQERGQGEMSAIQEVQERFNLRVISIVTLDQVIEYLKTEGMSHELEQILSYQAQYGVK